jgi:hypothetical protein
MSYIEVWVTFRISRVSFQMAACVTRQFFSKSRIRKSNRIHELHPCGQHCCSFSFHYFLQLLYESGLLVKSFLLFSEYVFNFLKKWNKGRKINWRKIRSNDGRRCCSFCQIAEKILEDAAETNVIEWSFIEVSTQKRKNNSNKAKIIRILYLWN